ncbi:PREDICTED: glutamyl-tRNA(Gln) amidotransferase subunit C, mitochondrial [Polistes dominula]|uniref:Glutamyl-tRNA(Gln) amidotransferase subunit C, mitochondrial n=1 Tax=Polistes dominula TaxID=743375 RepID=A0ABM1I0D4_POLDO|nr:PREDICTED: glutamyl-tRNA(Gln) amidotransferase subunit C, mitochondrial [Polistes dominula]
MRMLLQLYRCKCNSFLRSKIASFRYVSTCESTVQEQLDQTKIGNASVINEEFINKLEKLSLVGYNNDRGIAILKAAVNFSERLRNIDIPEEIQPLYNPLEEQNLYIREDEVKEINNRQEILKNAQVLEEEYFITPLQSHKNKSCV